MQSHMTACSVSASCRKDSPARRTFFPCRVREDAGDDENFMLYGFFAPADVELPLTLILPFSSVISSYSPLGSRSCMAQGTYSSFVTVFFTAIYSFATPLYFGSSYGVAFFLLHGAFVGHTAVTDSLRRRIIVLTDSVTRIVITNRIAA